MALVMCFTNGLKRSLPFQTADFAHRAAIARRYGGDQATGHAHHRIAAHPNGKEARTATLPAAPPIRDEQGDKRDGQQDEQAQ